MRVVRAVHPSAPSYRRLLHRILHRFFEMVIGHLQRVLSGNLFAVADPCADDMRRKRFFQFGLPRAAEILDPFRPGLQASALDDAFDSRAEVFTRVPANRNDAFGARFGQLEALLQIKPQFGEQRNRP